MARRRRTRRAVLWTRRSTRRCCWIPQTIFVAGGGEIYRAAWDRLDRLEITEVDQNPAGEVTFPEIDPRSGRKLPRAARRFQLRQLSPPAPRSPLVERFRAGALIVASRP